MTDQITVSRALLRQAIDALSDTQTDGESPQWDIEKAAYDALRTALEQPVQEPIGWYWEYNGRPEGKVFFGKTPDQDVIARGLSAEFPCIVRYVYAAPQAQQPACMWPVCQTEKYQQYLADQISKELIGDSPRKAVKLTDEEFQAIKVSLSRQEGWDGDGWDLALKEAIQDAFIAKNGIEQ